MKILHFSKISFFQKFPLWFLYEFNKKWQNHKEFWSKFEVFQKSQNLKKVCTVSQMVPKILLTWKLVCLGFKQKIVAKIHQNRKKTVFPRFYQLSKTRKIMKNHENPMKIIVFSMIFRDFFSRITIFSRENIFSNFSEIWSRFFQ